MQHMEIIDGAKTHAQALLVVHRTALQVALSANLVAERIVDCDARAHM